jgi:repressor LexA
MEAEEMVELPSGTIRRQSNDLYALRVHGTSMIDALIDDGDIVVLRRPTDINNGDLVAAWLITEQEATLKRIFREGNLVKLQPANSQLIHKG